MARRHWGFVVLLVGLLALEGFLAFSRLDAIRRTERATQLTRIERLHGALTQQVQLALEEPRRVAALVANHPATTRLAEAGEPDSRSGEVDELVRAVLDSDPAVLRIQVLEGGPGNAGTPPRVLFSSSPDPTLPPLPTPIEEFVRDSENERDRSTFEQSATGLVLHSARRVGETPTGAIAVVTFDAGPIVDPVREFAPLGSVRARLCDRDGNYLDPSALASPIRGLLGEFGTTAAPLLERLDGSDASELRVGRTRLVALRIRSGGPALACVTVIPDAALDDALDPLTGEYLGALAGTFAIAACLLAVAFVFLRSELALRELSREREVENQLQVAERLRSIGLLTAGVAHEINNPLEGISNYLTLLEKDEAISEKSRKYVDRVRYGFDRIRRVVSDFLDFARPDVGSSRADLTEICRRTVALVRYSEDFRGVTVDLLGLERPLMIAGDARRLEQVLLNLLLNAARAMGGEGRITIRAAIDPRERRVRVVVEDDGPGIPGEALERIFDPFYTTTEGSGFGLAVSYSIVRAHGSELRVRNRPRGGAEFSFELRYPDPREPSEDTPKSEPSRSSR